jgi:hypothetical protein
VIGRHLLVLLVVDVIDETSDVYCVLESCLHPMHIPSVIASGQSSHVLHASSFASIVVGYVILAVIVLFALEVLATQS